MVVRLQPSAFSLQPEDENAIRTECGLLFILRLKAEG
jgi:hypothetical protein